MTGKGSAERKVSSFMNNRLISIESDRSIADAARAMVENKMSSVIVTKGGKITGIATERDIVKIAANNVGLDGVTIGSLMSAPLVSISKDASIEELADTMIRNRVRHLVVTDGNGGNIVGITSVTDVARYLKEKLASKETAPLFEAIYPTEYPSDEEREKLFW